MTFVGLDIETTGLSRAQNHRLIQIGWALADDDFSGSDVYPEGSLNIDAESMAINGFTLERIAAAALGSSVDRNIANQQLNFHGGELAVAVGWNVGSFDLPFIRADLPLTAAQFSHRCVDLTGICIMDAHRRGIENYRDLKQDWQNAAEKALGGNGKWHDAIWDARAALKVWELLRKGEL